MAHWWVEPGSGEHGCRVRGPGSSLGLLVGWSGSWPSLLWDPGCPKAGVVLLVNGLDPGAYAEALVFGAEFWALWWTGPAPGSSASALVGGAILGQLGAQEVLRQPACWWVDLCLCLANCLPWGVPVLAPKGCWVGPGSSANKPEGGFQSGTCQHPCPCGGTSSPKWLLPVSLSPGWAPVAFCLSGRLRSAGEAYPSSFQITPSILGPRACEILCVLFKSGVLSSQCRIPGLGSLILSLTTHSLGENLCNCNYPHFFGWPTQGYWSWLYHVSAPLAHLILVPSLYI